MATPVRSPAPNWATSDLNTLLSLLSTGAGEIGSASSSYLDVVASDCKCEGCQLFTKHILAWCISRHWIFFNYYSILNRDFLKIVIHLSQNWTSFTRMPLCSMLKCWDAFNDCLTIRLVYFCVSLTYILSINVDIQTFRHSFPNSARAPTFFRGVPDTTTRYHALIHDGECASHGNPDVHNDLVECPVIVYY